MFGRLIGEEWRQNRIIPVLAILLSVWSLAPAAALDLPPEPEESLADQPIKMMQSVYDAMRRAVASYSAGDKADAVKSLELAANQGHAPAHWKLARMYAEGDGVPQDDAKAFKHFSLVCDGSAEISPNSPDARFVSSSFLALGNYYLTGIASAAIKPNPTRSRELYTYTATYFGDPEAQFRLGGLYIDGIGGSKDIKQGLRWLNLAAEKGHRLAQAKLGTLLFDGISGARQRARGLMWLSIAADGADPIKEIWITELRDEAMSKATENDRMAADAFREKIKVTSQK